MKHPIRFLLIIAVACNSLAGACAVAEQYHFQGSFQALQRRQLNVWSRFPVELEDAPFEITISWPDDEDAYSTDSQPGDSSRGAYRSEEVAVQVDVAGFDFSAPPVISTWNVRNDANLDYFEGVPQTSGDELSLATRAEWNQSFTLPSFEPPESPFVSPESTIEAKHRLLLTLRAVDYDGDLLTDTALQTSFDLTEFDEVWFELREVVPVASNDEPRVYYEWEGTIDSFAAVPEPETLWLGLLPLSLLVRRRRLLDRCL